MNTGRLRQPSAVLQQYEGFSIVELMVAMTLSLILLAGVLSVFAGSRSTYETIDRLSRVQENGRFALDQIVADIRSAGYLGCARATKYWTTTLNSATTLPWDFTQSVYGFEASATAWSPTLDTVSVGTPGLATSGSPVYGNDVLVLHGPKRNSVSVALQSDMTNATGNPDPTTTITIPNTSSSFTSGDIVRISNCEAQAVFQVTGYSAGVINHDQVAASSTTPGNASKSLSYPFTAGSEVIPLNTIIYYVGVSTADITATSLWRIIGTSPAEELVEGVDAMQVIYGVNTDGDTANTADQYMTAAAVDAGGYWGSVVSVSIALLERSLDQYGSEVDNQTYTLLDATLGKTVGPYNDRRIRRIFTSTTTLRNRTS